ncbi:MAG: CPBP family intramembrane glutamic endopeptidase [Aeromicrobium sp.]
MPIWRLLLLHLVPGALATLVYVLLADPVEAAGYPALMALLIAIAVVIIPFELGVVLIAGRGEADMLSAIPYRDRMTARDWLWLVPLLVVVGILGFGVLGIVEQPVRDGLFGWLPAWFLNPLPTDDIGAYSSAAWTTTLSAYLILNVFAGPTVEELYFRGYLLPRMGQFGRWAPLVNVILFSLYHFWSPWQFLSRIAGVTPFAYAVWWKRNVYLGVVVHVLLNGIGTVTVIVFVMNQL